MGTIGFLNLRSHEDFYRVRVTATAADLGRLEIAATKW